MKQDDSQELGRAHALAVAAALAMLGMSVGVNVQELLAADQVQSDQTDQNKIAPRAISKKSTIIKSQSRGVEGTPATTAPMGKKEPAPAQ